MIGLGFEEQEINKKPKLIRAVCIIVNEKEHGVPEMRV